MPVYYFVPFIVSNHYLLFWVSNGHNSVTVQNRTHVYVNFSDHKDLGNHLLQLCPKVAKHTVSWSKHTYTVMSLNSIYYQRVTQKMSLIVCELPLFSYHCTDHSQISQVPSSIQWGWLVSYFIAWDSPSVPGSILCHQKAFILCRK